MPRRPPLPTPFPYTTLFRSPSGAPEKCAHRHRPASAPAVRRDDEPSDQLPALLRLRASQLRGDRKSTRLNSSHEWISYAVFCLKKKKTQCNATTACPIG